MSDTLNNPTKPTIVISKDTLVKAGFMNSGIEEFQKRISIFTDNLFKASIDACDSRSLGGEREVTREHVYQANHLIYTHRPESVSIWSVILQIVQIVASAGAGVGGSNLNEEWGTLTFGISLAIMVIVSITRILLTNR